MIGHQPRHHHTSFLMEVVRNLQGMSKFLNGLGQQTKPCMLFFLEVVIRWDTYKNPICKQNIALAGQLERDRIHCQESYLLYIYSFKILCVWRKCLFLTDG